MRIPNYVRVFDFMREKRTYTIEEIAVATKLWHRATAQGLRTLVKRGLVERVGTMPDKRIKLFKTKQRDLKGGLT